MHNEKPAHSGYSIEVVEDGVFVEFHTTTEHLERAYFPVTDDNTALIERTTGQKFIDALKERGYDVGYNGYF